MSRVRITRIVARLNVGGPAMHILNLTAALDAARFESQLVVGRPGPHEGDMGYLAAQKGIVPHVLPELGRELSPTKDLWTVWRLVQVLRRQRPHIVETHTAKAGAVGRLAARLAGVPIVLHVFHGHVFYGYFGPAKTRFFIAIERGLARLSDRIITISPGQQRDIAHVYRIASPDKVIVVPLGLDLEPFTEAGRGRSGRLRASYGVPAGAPLVGFVGRLTAVKNPSLLVEAAREVVDAVPEAHFVFVGDGELRPELEGQVAELGLGERVLFAGWQTDMPAVYADLDALVLPSLNEGTSMTVIEAMATGVPVIATAVGGVPDVVSDGHTGRLVPSSEVGPLAQAIVDLLRDPGLAQEWARAGQQDVLARYGLRRLARDMESLYMELLAEKGIRV